MIFSKSTKCVFLGYCEGIKTYRLMCLHTKKIIKSSDVEFLEHKSVHEHLEICLSRNNDVFVDTSFNLRKKEEDDENKDGKGMNEDEEA